MSLFVFTLACAESSIEQLGLCHTPWQLPAVPPSSTDRWVLRTVWMSRRADTVFSLLSISAFLFSHACAGGSSQRAARPGTSTLRRCWAAWCWSSAVILTMTPLKATAPSAFLLTSWHTISVRTGFGVATLVGHSVWPYRLFSYFESWLFNWFSSKCLCMCLHASLHAANWWPEIGTTPFSTPRFFHLDDVIFLTKWEKPV